MSSVRMCDRCGNIFSEREDGWTSMQGTTMRRDDKGQMKQTTEALDACARCSAARDVPRPMLADWSHETAPEA